MARGRAARKHCAVLRGPDSPPPRPAPGTGSLTDLSGPGRGSGPRVRRHRRPHDPRRGCCSPCRRRTTGVRTEARVASTRGRRAAAAFRRGPGRVHAHTAVGSDDTVAGGRGSAADGFRNTGARRHAPETALLLCYGTPKPLPRPRPSCLERAPCLLRSTCGLCGGCRRGREVSPRASVSGCGRDGLCGQAGREGGREGSTRS